MGALDDLLNKSEQKKSALDYLLAETEQARPTPGPFGPMETQPPMLSNPGPDAVSFEQVAAKEEQRRALERQAESDAAQTQFIQEQTSQLPPERRTRYLAEIGDLVKSGAYSEPGAIPTKELETAAVIGASLLFPPLAVGPAALGTVGRTALGTGIIGAGENMAIDTAAAVAEKRLPTVNELITSGAWGLGGGAVAGGIAGKFMGKTGQEVTFGRKIKDIAAYYDTTPSQINKFLAEAAGQAGTDRGSVADGLLEYAARNDSEGAAAHFKDYFNFPETPPEASAVVGRVPAEAKIGAWIRQGVIQGNPQEAIQRAYFGMAKSSKTGSAIDNLLEETGGIAEQAPRMADDIPLPLDPTAPVVKPMMPTDTQGFLSPSRPPVSVADTTFQSPMTQAAPGIDFAAHTEPEFLGRAYAQSSQQPPTGSGIGSYFGARNTMFTQDMYTQASANLRKKSKQLRTGIDPSDLSDLVKVGGYYIEGGVREFADWSARMVDDFGDAVRPHLKSIYDESINAIRRAAVNEQVLPSDFNEQAVVSDLTRAPAHRTLKGINISRLDDDGISNLIDNAVRESPEFQIPNETVAFDVLTARAKRFSTGTIDEYLKDYDPSKAGTPEGDIRKIAADVIAAENVLKNHMETRTLPMAKLISEGQGDKEAFRELLIGDLRLLRKVGGVSSEFGRALGSRRIKATGEWGMEQRFMREINKVLGKDADLDQVATRLSQIDIIDPTAREIFLRDLIHATTREKIDEFFYNSILSSLVTQGRNVLGNLGTILVRETERPIATTIDLMRAMATGTARQRHYGESMKSIYGLLEGTREGIAAGWKSFKSEVPQFGLDASIASDRRSQRIGGAIRGKTGRVIRVPSRLLMATDDFFKAVAYRMEINARAYREARLIGKTNKLNQEQVLDLYNDLRYRPTDSVMKGAKEEALLRTFQTPSGALGRAMSNATNRGYIMRYFIPFVRTPLNIMEFGVERIPGVNLLSILNRKSQGLPVNWTDELAKTAFGTMIGAGVYLAHQHGIVNGFGPPERSGEERAFLTSGQQRYAFNIGDTSISFQNFEPITTILGMMADTADLINSGVPVLSGDFAVSMGRNLGRNLTEKPFGMGLDTFLNLVTGDYERAKTGTFRTMASAIPFSSFSRSIAQGIDPTVRRVQTLEDAFRMNIPGLRGDIEPVIDLWGREVVTEAGVVQRMAAAVGVDLGLGGQILDGMTNPTKIRDLTDDPATKEVNRLLKALPDAEFEGLGTPSREVKGVKMTREQYIQYSKLSGQRAHEAALKFIGTSFYMRMTDENKQKSIERIIKQARTRTRNELFRSQ